LLKTFTKSEIEESEGAALAAPASADSAAKGKFKFAESRRKKRMKKNAKILKNFLNFKGRIGCVQLDCSSCPMRPSKKQPIKLNANILYQI